MTQEVLIPKMKRLNEQQKKIRIPVFNFVLILFCTFLIIGSTFLNLDIKHYILPEGFFSGDKFTPEDFVYSFSIVPQIPLIMFICSTLGKKMATTSVILYILTGLFFFPVFALGGGPGYIFEYGFGYILGYIPAVIIAGTILEKKYSFWNMILAAICGVLIIHICGISYMAILALLKHDGGSFISGWISAQSGLKIVYDIVISFILILIGKYLNECLKFII